MKHALNSVLRCTGNLIARKHATSNFVLSFLILTSLVFTSCMKEEVKTSTREFTAGETLVSENKSIGSQANVVHRYEGLPTRTEKQLQLARSSSARYRNIENAFRDGYENINVIAPNMGHHFMNFSLLNDGFDPAKPEILVYNKNEDGDFELVAVEYAVHLTDPMPEGFYGSQDEWDDTSGFPFWLLHAWVWTYNPDGVFNPTNPDVHLHE
jgi:hypothetical protein